MSAHRSQRAVVAMGTAAVALLALAVLLSPSGAPGTVRTVVGCLAVLVAPGWLATRLADEDGEWVTRATGGAVVSLGVCAVCGFVAYELGLRVATAVFAVPLLVVVAVAACLGAVRPPARRAPLTGLLAAAAISVPALLGAMGTHLLLPAAPVEPAFSIEAAHAALATANRLFVTVTVARVRTDAPTHLTLTVGGRVAAVAVVPPGATTVRLVASLHGTRCGDVGRVVVAAPNGAFLTPPVGCVTLR